MVDYDPDIHFGTFEPDLSAMLIDALISCNFPFGELAKFDLTHLDVLIRDDQKGANGKWYIAFLNSICTFTLHRYMEAHAKYHGAPFIIDSPATSLKEKGETLASNSVYPKAEEMKVPLFRYFLKVRENFQTIIIENEIPDIDYGTDTTIIRYSGRDDAPDSYGFLVEEN